MSWWTFSVCNSNIPKEPHKFKSINHVINTELGHEAIPRSNKLSNCQTDHATFLRKASVATFADI